MFPVFGVFWTASLLTVVLTVAFTGTTHTPLYGSGTQVAAEAGEAPSSGAPNAAATAAGASRALRTREEVIWQPVRSLKEW
ncbi:MAG: hypothetical protein AUG44_03650 [Actinobacteria bacterium 13_1_20CM_3_71_11]|nr:MAG: hypothetical protein AUG44_03650 [Actinobacteria bacterium 13_1_20CM_3_71_11]